MRFKIHIKIVSTKDAEKHGITLNVFDELSVKEWKNKINERSYFVRYENLQKSRDNA